LPRATRQLLSLAAIACLAPSCGPSDTPPGEAAAPPLPAGSEPESPARADLARGLELFAARQYRAAVEPLHRAFALDPNAAPLAERLAECLIECERHEEALEVLRRAPAAASTRERAKLAFLEGRAAKELGRLGDAERALRRSLELLPGNPASCALLGSVLALARKHAEAVGELREALAALERAGVADGRGQVHYQLAQSLRALGREDEAAAHAEAHRALRAAEEDRLRRDALPGAPER
jgi:tetratricopeptide (TPR) repeat protein